MKRISIILILLVYGLQFSCSNQEENLIPKREEVPGVVPERIVAKLKEAGFFTSEGLSIRGNGYIVEFDIFLTEEKIDELIRSTPKNGRTQHYRTTNLVNVGGSPRIINTYVDPGFAPTMQTAIDVALGRFNNENLGLRFQRTENAGAADIRINAFYEESNTLGSGTFPSGGNPGSDISMNTYWYNTPRADAASVVAHEIGHNIGFRHTDYMDRAYSCFPSGGNEGDGGVGAIYIPGTPGGPAPNSWMLACSSGADRPFTSDDRTALNNLYPAPVISGGQLLLSSGQRIYSNQSVTTSDVQVTLTLQGDGNLVAYRGSQPVWSSGTAGTPVNECAMQTDGNLVLYGPGAVPYWHTSTYMYPGGYLVVNGNNVLSIIQNGVARWTSGEAPPVSGGSSVLASGETLNVDRTKNSPDGRFTLIMQADGNLVLYQGSTPLWASGTAGTPVVRCSMQGDGNLVLYSSNGTPYWASGTDGYPGSQLELESNGNMKITQNGVVRWISNTCCH